MAKTTPPTPPPLPSGDQESAVVMRLQRGPLTPLEALRELGVYRLAAVVYRLRDAGWPVQTELLETECRGGRKARVARYHLATEGQSAC